MILLNIFIGNQAGASNQSGINNVYIGRWAGKNSRGTNTNSGSYNVFIGESAGKNIVGIHNVVLGSEASLNNKNVNTSVILGYQAGYGTTNNTEGSSQNVFIGNASGYGNVSGNRNVFVGCSAGHDNVSGEYNVFLGRCAGYANNDGNGNLYLGESAGGTNEPHDTPLIYGEFDNKLLKVNGKLQAEITNNTTNDKAMLLSAKGTNTSNNVFGSQTDVTGKAKVAYGDRINISTTSSSIYVFDAYVSNTASTDNVYAVNAIVDNVKTGSQNIAVRGISRKPDGASTSAANNFGVWAQASGGSNQNVGIHASATGTNAFAGYFLNRIYVNGSIIESSDKRLKKDIQTLDGALDKVLKLRGVSYYWKNREEVAAAKGVSADSLGFDYEEGKQIGVIAQEVEEIYPELVTTDADGFKSVDYTKLAPVLIEAIKEQQQQIDELKRLVEELMKKQ